MSASPIHIKEIRSLISYCCAIFCSCTIPNFVDVVCDANPKSCSRSYYILASIGFWVIYPMILEQGMQMTSTVAYINSLAM